ncbi:hypothetical protein KAJ61_02105 [Candidatus Parcubacteria bacterium]|nr:hypothetical protein [Candidatus Parcubacteria bacterium]
MHIINLLEIIFLLVLVFWFFFFIAQAYNIIFKGYAPFISTKKSLIKKIIDNIELKNNAVICELGCGRAGFLHFMRKKFPNSKIIGYEYALLPFFLAKVQNWFKKSNLDIRRNDIFKVDLSKTDLVYCFLSVKMMKLLKDKFLKELKPGAQIVSYQFRLPEFEPIKVVTGDKPSEKIYFYKIK